MFLDAANIYENHVKFTITSAIVNLGMTSLLQGKLG